MANTTRLKKINCQANFRWYLMIQNNINAYKGIHVNGFLNRIISQSNAGDDNVEFTNVNS